jgi:hypothetical protein
MLRLHPLEPSVEEIRKSPVEPRVEVSKATVTNEIVDLDETSEEGFLDMVLRGTPPIANLRDPADARSSQPSAHWLVPSDPVEARPWLPRYEALSPTKLAKT